MSFVAPVVAAPARPHHPVRAAHLTKAQDETANCMVAVVRDLPEVTDARLTVRRRVLITYTYHHQIKGISPRVSPESLDISDILSGKQQGFVLGGLVPGITPQSSEADVKKALDDADSGMLRITNRWNARCGLRLSTMTV
jgi:hypothetical protein